MKSATHKCPACSSPLNLQIEDGTVLLFCSIGRCPSPGKMNDGAKAESETLAFAKLKQAWEEEQDEMPRD